MEDGIDSACRKVCLEIVKKFGIQKYIAIPVHFSIIFSCNGNFRCLYFLRFCV